MKWLNEYFEIVNSKKVYIMRYPNYIKCGIYMLCVHRNVYDLF